MFTWICPKCGGEVPPAYSECPRCNPPKAREPVVLTEPQPAAAPPPPPPPVAAPMSPPPPPAPQPAVQYVPTPPPEPRYAPPPPPPPYEPPPLSVGQMSYGAPQPPARTVSPMLVGAGAALGVVALLAVLYIYVLPHNGDAAASKAEPEVAAPAAVRGEKAAEPVAKPATTHPLAKHIEVGGIRIQEHSGGNVRIDFVVINHSAADLPGLNMEVRIVSAGREYFLIPVKLPSIGPYESKDMSTTVKTALKPYELPDWQMVQAKFTLQD